MSVSKLSKSLTSCDIDSMLIKLLKKTGHESKDTKTAQECVNGYERVIVSLEEEKELVQIQIRQLNERLAGITLRIESTSLIQQSSLALLADEMLKGARRVQAENSGFEFCGNYDRKK